MAEANKALGTPPPHPRSQAAGPPSTPRPQRKTIPLDEYKSRRSLQPRALRLDDDEGGNKENQAPYQKEEDQGLLDEVLHQLLKTWEEDIEQLREQVSRELDGCKKKLGIR
ncbi:E1/E4 protein [Human papillomavirus type 220]|uniref:E1/E4 protein n=1 Tax=Human papillomavirus type 220 TaxID=2200957 RepID=A0A2S1ZRW3_9PAPI|nr:E1/E4 protein [Human papillomavirus type 220]